MTSYTGVIYMYITGASPNKRSLGAVNGLALTLVSISRMLAPTVIKVEMAFFTKPLVQISSKYSNRPYFHLSNYL